MRHVLGIDAVDLDDLISDSQTPVRRCGPVHGDSKDEQRHGMEFAPAPDREPEPAGASLQFDGVVLIVELEHVEFLILLNNNNKKKKKKKDNLNVIRKAKISLINPTPVRLRMDIFF